MWMPTKPSDLFIFGDFLSASGRRGNGVEDARSVYLEPQLLSKSLQMCGGGRGEGKCAGAGAAFRDPIALYSVWTKPQIPLK